MSSKPLGIAIFLLSVGPAATARIQHLANEHILLQLSVLACCTGCWGSFGLLPAKHGPATCLTAISPYRRPLSTLTLYRSSDAPPQSIPCYRIPSRAERASLTGLGTSCGSTLLATLARGHHTSPGAPLYVRSQMPASNYELCAIALARRYRLFQVSSKPRFLQSSQCVSDIKNLMAPKVRLPLLSNFRAILLLSVIVWHQSRCGENDRCMPGLLPTVVGTSSGLVNTLPKVLGSSTLSGLMMLSGSVHAGYGYREHYSLWRDLGRTVLPGLLVQFVLAPFFDFYVISTIPTNGHVWFLYSLALAKLLVHFVGRCGGGSVSVVATTLSLSLCASPIWHAFVAVAPGLSGTRYDGLTWSSGDWFLPLSVRNLSYPVFFAFGVVVCPTSALLALRRRCDSISSRCGSHAWLWLLNGCFWAYSMQRLRLGGTNLFASAGLATWFARLPQQLEMLLVSLTSPLALLMLVPDDHRPFLTAAGDSTLSVYLLHPFALKLGRPLLTSAVTKLMATQGSASPADQTFNLLLELLFVPLTMLVSLSWLGTLLHKAARQAVRHWAGAAPCACVAAVVLAAIGATLPPPSPGPPHDRAHVLGASVGGGKAGSSGLHAVNLTIQNGHFVHAAWPTGTDIYVHGSTSLHTIPTRTDHTNTLRPSCTTPRG